MTVDPLRFRPITFIFCSVLGGPECTTTLFKVVRNNIALERDDSESGARISVYRDRFKGFSKVSW